MSDQIDADGFRANVGIILVDDDRRLFWGRRVGKRGWQFPQGGLDPEESAEDALYRELHEEVGLSPEQVELLGSTRGWLRYRLPRRFRRRNSHPVCVGQKQRWFVLRLLGDESDLRFDATGSPEFDDWRWVDDYWSPAREVIYFKRQVYARALVELAPVVYPEDPPPRPDWVKALQSGHRRR